MISHSPKAFVAATILLTVGIGSMHPVSSQPASQNPPAEANQERPTPVATINPKLPVKAILINQSKMTLEYGLTTSGTRRLAAGQTVTYNRVRNPFYAVFYPVTSSSNQYQEPAFKFDVTAKKNVVTVKIRQLQDGAVGDSVIRIRPDGGIFVK
ncbi:MAG: hypothetical protein WCA07_01000 [Gloeobacterales cyanobacterium]